MAKPQPLIDFTELQSSVPGEGLEELARLLGRRMRLLPVHSGRGPDGGRDLLYTETLVGPLVRERVRWLVSCKDKAKSGESVREKELPCPGIKDKLAQHRAQGFLLITTTTVSSAAKALLDSLDRSNGGDIWTLVWDSTELTAFLLEYQDLLQQFLPKSYQRVRKLTSLEGALLEFQDQLPSQVLEEIMRLVKPYSGATLKGSSVWPYDNASAAVIDEIVKHILLHPDPDAAVEATEHLEFDAFIAFVTRLQERYPAECLDYLRAVVSNHPEQDVRFNAAQFVFDNYDVSPVEQLRFAAHLDADSLAEIYGREIAVFVEEEILTNPSEYALHGAIDQLSSATVINSVTVSELRVDADNDERVQFAGKMRVEVTLVFEGEAMGGRILEGDFSGYFDTNGMYLEEASVDASEA